MAKITIKFDFQVDGAYADPTSVKLSDPTGTFGVKRTDTDGVVVADGVDMNRISTGRYEYEITPVVRGLTYFYYVEAVYLGRTYRQAYVHYDELPGGLTASDFLSGVQSSFNRPSLELAGITEALTNALQHMTDEGIHYEAVKTGECIAGQEYIEAPQEYKGMSALILYDMTGAKAEPLKIIEGGFRAHQEATANDATGDLPEWYTWHYDNFYLYRIPNAAYPYRLHYYSGHPSYDGTIYYPAKFKPLISVGVKYYYAMDIGNDKYINRWGPLFFERLHKVKKTIVYEPSIVGG